MKITNKLSDKRVLLWGYGLEGRSTEKFIRKYCAVRELAVFQGKREEIDEDAYDYIVKSPGIVAENLSDKYTSMTELFLEEFSDQVIGITGTKGKSTTSSLMFTVLSRCSGRPAILVGNIGLPALDYYGEITPDTIIVFEMSCHQLAHAKISPHIALFLNLYEEHLDYYGTMDKYFRAKANITVNQKPGDYFFAGDNVPAIGTAARKTVISYDDPMRFDMSLKGEHNQFNARFVYAVSTELFGCDPEKVREALKEFTGAIRAALHGDVGQQLRLLVHRYHQFRILDAVEFALEIIGVSIVFGRCYLLESCRLQISGNRNSHSLRTPNIGGQDHHDFLLVTHWGDFSDTS